MLKPLSALLALLCALPLAAQDRADVEQLQKFARVYRYLTELYVDDEDMAPVVEGAIAGMLERLAPHSAYLPADEQSRFWIDYAQGFYKVMERIRAKYPAELLQACASGGGREEYGALKSFDAVWTSDNTAVPTPPSCWVVTSWTRRSTRRATSRPSSSASTWPAPDASAWSFSPGR